MTDEEYEDLDMAIGEQREAYLRARGKAKKVEWAKFTALTKQLVEEMTRRGLLMKVGEDQYRLRRPLN
jgi:hypothetical protein